VASTSSTRTGTATVPFASGLAAYGDRTALITRTGEVSYRDLAAKVEATAERLGARRRLVLLAGSNDVDSVAVYLAALSAGHPVMLVPGDNPGSVEALTATYDPDVVVRPVAGQWRFEERLAASAHTLHPDLALLLSTSGSTGSPKLVRLSHGNVQANAESIAGYLGIRGTDRAATTLPMHYCYGLSVINSHLLRGAALIVTDLSVVDTCFWDLFRDRRGTTFAGVPYTFDLLDRVGFADMRLPDLRYVTQAGGRLAPDRVRRYAELGQRNGWDLYVMYGQTEATARMAYLPPDLAASHPHAIGIPIPGGSFALEPLPGCDDPNTGDPDTGELVYTGPNVMLGYAETPADLGLGRSLDTLRTGDIARRTSDGLYEIVGRRSRFAKVFGLRIDLERVEAILGTHGLTVCCVDADDHLVVAVEGGDDADRIQRLAARECGLPGARGPRPSGHRPAPPGQRQARPRGRPRTRARHRRGNGNAGARSAAGRPARATRPVRRHPRPAGRHRRQHLREPGRRLAVLCGDVGPARGGAGPPARRLAHHSDPRPAPGDAARRAAPARSRTRAGARHQRGPARDRDRPHRRLARPVVRHPRRRPPAARGRGLQLRPLSTSPAPAAVNAHGICRPASPVSRSRAWPG
jgi:acyl-CoA synthetase (AMP-forming)/AMP-acid ligase II